VIDLDFNGRGSCKISGDELFERLEEFAASGSFSDLTDLNDVFGCDLEETAATLNCLLARKLISAQVTDIFPDNFADDCKGLNATVSLCLSIKGRDILRKWRKGIYYE
jgi:hypothetical protein